MSKTALNPATVPLPSLTTYPAYAAALKRREKIVKDAGIVGREREEVANALFQEFGSKPPLSQMEMDALRMASGEDDPLAARHRALSAKSRELQEKADVLHLALEKVASLVEGAKRDAQNAIAPEVFRDTYRPVLKLAAESVLAAVAALQSVKALQARLEAEDLAVGPNYAAPLPLFALDTVLDPADLLDALVFANVFDAATAADYRKRLVPAG